MQIHDLVPVKSGRTYKGIKFTLPSEPAYSLIGANIHIQVRQDADSDAVKSFDLTATGEFTFEIPPQRINIKAGTYQWDLLIVFSDGRAPDPYVGGSWVILPSITKKPV